jgi:hypothetical protein
LSAAPGSPDPLFTGGFLGLHSTTPLVRAGITFSATAAAFAVDNLRFAPATATVPEPASIALLLYASATAREAAN